MNEVWKQSEMGYEVSNTGKVRSVNRILECGRRWKGKELKKWVSHNGYECVSLYLSGEKKNCYVHRLIWEAFNYKIPEGMEINHIDENKANNNISNLELCTRVYNINYGTIKERASKHRDYKLISQKRVKKISKPIICIKQDGEIIRYSSATEAARQVAGYKQQTINMALRGHNKTAYKCIWRYE